MSSMENHVHNADQLPVFFKHKLVDWKGTPLHEDYVSIMRKVDRLQCNEKDILVSSYQKTERMKFAFTVSDAGSTWLDTIITLIINKGNPNSLVWDETEDLASQEYKKFLFIEFKRSTGAFYGKDGVKFLDYVNKWTSPKTMRTHLPYTLLPRDVERNHPKVLYIYRNVKDVMVSYYYHFKYNPYKILDRLGTFEEFAEDFMAGRVPYGCYFEHLHGYWIHRHEPNFFVTTYDSLLQDRRGMIQKIAEFLEVQMSEEGLDNIVNLTSREQMKIQSDKTWRKHFTINDENGNQLHHFIRSGESGGWKKEFPPELAAKVDAWIAEKLMLHSFESDPFQR